METTPKIHPGELDANQPIADGWVLLDVREPDEWASGHAPGAIHIPLGEVSERIAELDPDLQILVMCRSGARSERATQYLNHFGYEATNLDGGILAWQEVNLPIVVEDGE